MQSSLKSRLWTYSLLYAGIVVAWTVWCNDILDAPPYQDQSVGWQEANFLVDTNFDYYRLRYVENHWTEREQGCRNYMTSILPTIWALLLKYCPTTQSALIAAHLLNIALSSLVLLMAMLMTRAIVGWLGAGLIAALIAVTPLFHSQTEMVGMDIPMTAFAMVSLALVAQHRFVWACFPALIAFLMKPTGSIVTAGTLAYMTILLLLAEDSKTRASEGKKGAPWGLCFAANLATLAVQVLIVLWGGSKHWSVHDSPSLATLSFALVPYLTPDLLLLFLIDGIASVVFALGLWRQNRRSEPFAGTLGREDPGSVLLAKNSPLTVLFLAWMTMILVLLAVTRVLFIPRYLILGVPVLYISLGISLLSWQKWRSVVFAVGVLGVAFHIANTNGRFFPDLSAPNASFVRNVPDADSRSNAFLERSCEYRPELQSARTAVRVIEAAGKGRAIFAGNPYTRYLTLPRLGYVSEAQQVYNSNYFDDAIRQYLCIAGRSDHPPILVWAGMARANLPPPNEESVVLYRDDFDDPLIVYELPPPKGLTSANMEEWYLDETFPGSWPVTRLELRLPYLLETGRLDRAFRELKEVATADPDSLKDPRISWFQAQSAEVRMAQRLLPSAIDRETPGLASAFGKFLMQRTPIPKPYSPIPQVGESPPRLKGCKSVLEVAAQILSLGETADAQKLLEMIASSAETTDGGSAQSALALLQLARGKYAEATSLVNEIPHNVIAPLALLERGEYQQAAIDLETLSQKYPKDIAVLSLLGIAHAKLGKWELAASDLTSAKELLPDDTTLTRQLQHVRDQLARERSQNP